MLTSKICGSELPTLRPAHVPRRAPTTRRGAALIRSVGPALLLVLGGFSGMPSSQSPNRFAAPLAYGAPGAKAAPSPGTAGPADARFTALVDGFFDEYTAYYPTEATTLGLHQHDGDLEDLSPAAIAREIGWLQQWQGRFAQVPAEQLAPELRFDAQLIDQQLRALRFEREQLQDHRRRPDLYVGLGTRGINAIIKREYAPARVRLDATVARLRKIPPLLIVAQQNLDRMSPAFIDITLRTLESTARFFRNDVVAAFPGVKEPAPNEQLRTSAEAAAVALESFGEFLRHAGKAKATAGYALGATLFQEKLWADEMIDTPLPELIRRSEAELKRLQEEFRATARRIDVAQPAAVVQLALQKDHPAPPELISFIQGRLASQRQFLIDHAIVTVPTEGVPQVKETPAFRRATTLASMDTPGPYEKSTEAFYYITLPEPTLSAVDTEDFLRGAYNRPLIDVVSIHEVFPGHYVQFLWLSQLSKTRKFITVSSSSEGWAHYTEQMMLDSAYGNNDPRLRLAQLQDALLRAARFVVAIKLHTQGMTMEQAAEFFVKDGFQTRQVAEIEARRGTEDPMYMVYTYGKLEILKLREEYKQRLGAAYTPRKFHDEFLRHGGAPLKLVRAALLDTK